MGMSVPHDRPRSGRQRLGRWLPLGAILLASIVAFAMGWHRHVSVETLLRYHDEIHKFIVANRLAAIALYIGLYVIVVSLSLPGGLVLTLTGGILFGGAVGGVAAIVGAAIGATIVF